MRSWLLFLLIAFSVNLSAQESDSAMVKRIYDAALTRSDAYENLRYLCKKIGHRLSGSPQAEQAVLWGKKIMDAYGLDKVYLQEVMVPHWTRGSKEEGSITIIQQGKQKDPSSKSQKIKISALGGSVGTEGVLQGEIIEIRTFEELKAMGKEKLKGKIVLMNRPMEPTLINTFAAYGGCVDQRHEGAVHAAYYGAKAVLVRSMTLADDDHPHTGSMAYADSVNKIPAVAISTQTAEMISAELQKGNKVISSLELSCELKPDVLSYNVIGEIKGTEFPDQIITVGGHLDSWDIGEGAHDDGAGIVQSMEVLHLFKMLGIQPKRTIRAVLFMNEENGNRGGKKYAEEASEKKEDHFFALESDRGGFVPRGFSVDGPEKSLEKVRSWSEIFEPYDLHFFEKGYGGVDIGPLKKYFEGITLIGLIPDSQRYFDHHHAETDVFESVNKRELELGAAAMASLIYLVDKYGW